MPELFCAAGVELAQHELVQHRGLEQRLFVAKSFPDEDEGHDGLAARVEPEGVEGVQRLLGGLMERQVEGEAAVVLPAALVGKDIVRAVLVQRNSDRPLGPYWLRRFWSFLDSRNTIKPRMAARRRMEKTAFMCASRWNLCRVFLIVTQHAPKCVIIFEKFQKLMGEPAPFLRAGGTI